MLKQILEKQASSTSHYFNSLDLEQTEKIVELLLNCKGIIFFTGVGKSGLVAKKIAFTMVSTGTRSMYLSPIDALHGDLGMVTNNDIFIILSKSGESDELINLVPAIRNRGAILISVVCNAESRLTSMCHHNILLPFERELCPFDMAPTTSTTVQVMFGDLLSIALMQHKKFSIDQYALNHPSGRIGKRITLKVKDLMLTGSRVPFCHPEAMVKEILVELSNKRCGCILVVDDKHHLQGIFTDGDLRRSLQKNGGAILDVKIHELMTVNPRSTGPDVMAWEAMKFMESDYQKRIMMMPVLDENRKLLGLIHMHDVVQSGL
ncbi:MAG: KpsF/GutQ family sugar-phosphate isomerase [Parachlamydiaceae bacterium]|nr:KpsF/GutQ family sugar-phosphate isomerase [Parachlamydiaceae bacterium]